MAGLSDYKLKFVIDADGTTAKNALNSLYGDVNKLGGAFTSAFGGAIPVVGAVAGAIAAVGTAAAGVGLALFNLSKQTAVYGSEIYNASVKTGLGAETISALKLSSERTGVSMESLGTIIGRFSKVVGEAAQGSDEAKEKLKRLGLDPKEAIDNLDVGLGKAFKRISELPKGIAQATAAQQLFGKAGTELLKVLDDFHGDLPALIAEAKRLGVTLSDEDARAADEFGDQMDMLNVQLAGVGRTIGMAVMPEFMAFAKYTSEWLADNKGEIQNWATATKESLSGVIGYWNDLGEAIKRSRQWADEQPGQMPKSAAVGRYDPNFDLFKKLRDRGRLRLYQGVNEQPDDYAAYRSGQLPYGVAKRPDYLEDLTEKKIKKPPKETDAEFRKFFSELGFNVTRTFGEALNAGSPHTYGGAADVSVRGKSTAEIFTLMVKSLEKGYRVFDEQIAAKGVKQTGPHLHIENAKTALAKASRFTGKGFDADQVAYLKKLDEERLGKQTGGGGYEDFRARQVAEAKKADAEELENHQRYFDDWLRMEGQSMEERLDMRRLEADYAEEILRGQLQRGEIDEVEHARRVSDMRVRMLEEERDEVAAQIPTRENIIRLQKLDLQITTEREKAETEVAEAIERQNQAFIDQLEHIDKLEKKNQRPGTMKKREIGEGGFLGTLDAATGKVRTMGDVWKQVGNEVTGVFMQMGQGLGSMLESWVLLGGQSDISMKKMVAATLAGVAAQSATLAVFHTAMGIAALTPWGAAMYGPAILHFKAAALWAGIAVGTALLGRAAAGNSNQQGSGAGGGSGSYSGSGSSGQAAPPRPISRVSDDAFISGRRPQDMVVAAAIDKLNAKLDSMSPGDVLTIGAKQRPRFIGNQVVSDVRSDSSIGSRILKGSGVK